VLTRLLTRHGNRVGAMFFSGKVETTIPPRSGRAHVVHILNTLLARPELPQAPATDLGTFLRAAHNVIRRRSLVFVVSDFISAPGWEDALMLLSQRHEVLAVRVFDPLETELPDLGMMVMQDAETGEQLFVDTHDRRFRKRFADAAAQHEANLRGALQRAGVDTLELSTQDDLLDTILRFTDLRRNRSQLASGRGGLPQHLEVIP
jgi:uncharacterized protein (DUF58 family)